MNILRVDDVFYGLFPFRCVTRLFFLYQQTSTKLLSIF